MDDVATDEDALLLRKLAAGDRNAIARRHVDFVYAIARRRVGDSHLAEDVTQAVFVILASKAKRLAGRVVLVGWLHRTTGYVAANAMKMRRRRLHHELRAASEQTEAAMTPEPTDPETMAKLDEAIGKLRTASRDALLLRYFQKRSLAEVSAALGITEEAAKKRVARAVEQLRVFLASEEGRTSPSQASVLTLLATVAPPSAPTSLYASVTQGAVVSPAVHALTKGVTLMMLSKQIGVAAALAAVLLSGGAAVLVTMNMRDKPEELVAARPTAGGKGDASTNPDDGRLVANVPQGAIQLIAVGSLADGEWWSPSGDRRLGQPIDRLNVTVSPEQGKVARRFVLDTGFVDNENGQPTSTISVLDSKAQGGSKVMDSAGRAVRVWLANVDPKGPAALQVRLAIGPWETFSRLIPGAADQPDAGSAILDSVVASQSRGTDVRVKCDPTGDLRAQAIDKAGRSYPMWPSAMRQSANPSEPDGWNVTFSARDIAPADVAEVVLQRRPFTHAVDMRNIATEMTTRTKPTITVTQTDESGKTMSGPSTSAAPVP